MRLGSSPLVVLSLACLWAPLGAEARPDPLGDRKRPTFQKPDPPAPPARRSDAEGASRDEAAEPDDADRARGRIRGAARERADLASDAAAPAPRPGVAGGPPPAPAAIGTTDGNYMLGPRDFLKIEIWNRADIEYEWRPVTITDEGMVFLPLLDDVKLGGLTVSQAITKLTDLYDAYIIQPQIFIQIVEYNARQVSVIGEVNNPGRYALKGDVTLTELLAQAGHLTKHASHVVRVIRETDADEPPEVRDVDLTRINEGDATDNIKVEPDDTVYVLTNKDIIYVSGAVRTEGYVDYEAGMSAQQAVILAGGLADGSAGNRAKIFRIEGGKTREIKVNLKDIKRPFPLEPGDIIKVPRSIF